MGVGITLDAERAVRVPASRARVELARALRDAGFKLSRETTSLIEARRGSQLAASVSAEKLPLVVTLRLTPRAQACDIQIHLEDAWRSPGGKTFGLNSKYDRTFQSVVDVVDRELGRLDPGAAGAFAPVATVSPHGDVVALERANAIHGEATGALAGMAAAVDRKLGGAAPDQSPPPSWKGVTRIRLVAPPSALDLDIPEAQAVLGVAALVGAQPGDMPEPLVRQIEHLAARLEEALESGLPVPEVPLRGTERDAVDFLRQQAAIREGLPVRRLLQCRDCRFEKIVNENYQRLAERNRKLGLLMGSVGATFGVRGGVSPFVLFGQLFRLKKLDPDFVCPRCQGMAADPFVITFCPQCGDRHQEGALRGCRCGHDFRADGARRLAERIAAAKARELAEAAAAAQALLPPPAVQAALPPAPPPAAPEGPLLLALELERGEEPVRVVTVDAVLVLGRERADVVLDDPRVSRNHLRLTPREDGLVLEDLGSSNGTSVDGHRITTPVLLRGGETMRVGGYVVRVVPAVRDGATVIGDVPVA